MSSRGPSWSWSYGSWILHYLCNQCPSPLMLWVWISIRVRSTTSCDKVWQWLATGRWFSPCPPVSSTNKTDHHDIHVAEILLKVALKQTNKDELWTHHFQLWLTKVLKFLIFTMMWLIKIFRTEDNYEWTKCFAWFIQRNFYCRIRTHNFSSDRHWLQR